MTTAVAFFVISISSFSCQGAEEVPAKSESPESTPPGETAAWQGSTPSQSPLALRSEPLKKSPDWKPMGQAMRAPHDHDLLLPSPLD
jgi:hypothetical protein